MRAASTARPPLRHDLVKSHSFAETRTPSLDEYPLLRVPVSPRLGSRLTSAPRFFGFTESPPPYPLPRTGFERLFASDPDLVSLAGNPWLDPPRLVGAWRWIRHLSSTSAIRTAHEHNHESSEPRHGSSMSPIQLALDWRKPPGGVEAPSASSITDSGLSPGSSSRAARRRALSNVEQRRSFVSLLTSRPGSGPFGPYKTSTRHQPSSHVPGVAAAKPTRPLPARAQRAQHACRSWPTCAHGSLSPSRSARAPPVTGPPRYRLEIRYRWSAQPKLS